MYCYCTQSSHHECNSTTGLVKCASSVEHCVVGKAGLKITQSCWEWPPRGVCPDQEGPCLLVGTNVLLPVCCCKGNLCNNQSAVYVKPSQEKRSSTTSPLTLFSTKKNDSSLLSLIMIVFVAVTLLAILTVILKRFLRNNKKYKKSKLPMMQPFTWKRNNYLTKDIAKIRDLVIPLPESISLATNSNEVNFYTSCKKNKLIAHGRFGQVWSGLVNSKRENNETVVAIKIFADNIEGKKSWENEQLIYSVLRQKPHPNILFFYGSEKVQQETNIELWLVVEYYPLGSLWEYLKNSTVKWKTLLKICQNIAAGLAHLHCFSDQSISPIAHRDIKSKNILLKKDLTACIADFGLAIVQGNCDNSFNNRVGTYNYMAPEILEGSINFDIHSFLRIDIFSMSLVFWEILSRCEFPEMVVPDFQFPFQDIVGEKPTLEQLRYCVTNKKLRPSMNSIWAQFPHVLSFCKTITECWDEDPDARLTAECVLERLNELYLTCDFM